MSFSARKPCGFTIKPLVLSGTEGRFKQEHDNLARSAESLVNLGVEALVRDQVVDIALDSDIPQPMISRFSGCGFLGSL